jgi:phosphohistidine swiveling domain-containing protein
MTPSIISLANYDGFSGSVGGKGANLLRLHMMGLPVPEFFCIGREAFSAFAGRCRKELEDLAGLLPSTAEMELPDLSRKMKEVLEKVPFPEDLCREIQSHLSGSGEEFFSVRSSALQEDSRANSFAGLFNTSLFVRPADVPAHVLECWLSVFEPGILGYCRRNRIDPLGLEMGVVVQRMVRSRVSGVMFTADPAGGFSEIIIVAGLGLGEGIVADLVETDTYRYDRTGKTIRANIQRKQFRIAFNEESGSGTCRMAVPEAVGSKPALEAETLQKLVELGLQAESGFGDYQDIEWAIDDAGAVYILQSRPITTIPPGEFTIFDNSNIVEGYPGISTPLTFSLLKNGYERNFSRMAIAFGVPKRIIQENRPIFRNMVGYIDGRIFYNLTNWYAIVNLNPTLGPRFTPAFDDMIGIRKEVQSTKRSEGPLRGTAQFAVFAAGIIVRYFTIGWLMKKYRVKFERLQQEVARLDTNSMTTHELARKIASLGNSVFSMIYVPLINDVLLMLQVAMTKKLMKQFKVQDSGNLLNGLMCGEKDMESVLPVHSIMRLSECLQAGGIRSDESPALLMERIRTDPALAKIREQFDEHIRLYGNRCPEELKLETDTFQESPVKLLETALRQAASGIRVAEMEAGEARVRSEAETELSKQLRGRPVQGWLLRLCIRKTRSLLRNREAGRLDRARIVGMFRSLYRSLGRKLAAERTLVSADDIYYLTEDEISEIVHGSSVFMDVSSVQTVVSQRRVQLDACKARQPEERLIFRGTGIRNAVRQAVASSAIATEAGGENAKVLTGTPCSPGMVEADAVVIDDPSSAPDVTRKIIVARMTDPGWVFLMIASAGLIVEKGSLLSHTAIIGRELGIPTIVGVRDAASRIRTGQRIRMDASKGLITL